MPEPRAVPPPRRSRKTPARGTKGRHPEPAATGPQVRPSGDPIGVAHLTAEYWPLARTGGLGEAVNGLASFQAASGQPTAVVLPLYRVVRHTAPDLERIGPFSVTLGLRTEQAWLYKIPETPGRPEIFLIEHQEYFDRDGIYGADDADYPDNARRFAFFCLAALTALPQIAPHAQVLHAHDWHTALAPVLLRRVFAGQRYYDRLGSVLSVHNAGFQGHFPPETMTDLGIAPELYTSDVFEWYGRMNVLKGGLAFCDVAVTVSPTHARELCTAEGGFGLHDMFIRLGDRMGGILNGVDPAAWNPAADSAIAAPYSADDLSGKRQCKAALQQARGLPQNARAPVFGMSARLATQKGLDIVLGSDLLSAGNAQFVFLGSGERRYERALAALALAHPERIAVEFNFTDRLEHRLLAGADALLMPSLYEPCGLTQMRAQRYGTIPVARRVGGLADSIADDVTGFLFDDYTPEGLMGAVRRAIDRYHQPAAWEALIRAAMGLPFGWGESAKRYLDLYRRAIASRPAST
ncbi:MAG TPA: glycogen/starch synthase [Gemmatimonadales bacterium]|nr:glycogen/starch synthase [Gemmatimonadales bacterium]